MESDRFYLEIAMREARIAFYNETYPVGAVIVGSNGEIISEGHNRVYDQGDFTSHAEMEAIRMAGDKLMRWECFRDCTLYTTLEPCLMCCGAILHARIARVVWVKNDEDHGALRWLHDKTHPLNSLYVEKFDALEIIPAGEVDLEMRMDDWLKCWNGKKKAVENKWRWRRSPAGCLV